ncbi:hypothetical protein Q7C36_003296 [Tachysurus vachellii]|uniref:RBR-type E3 ubiquitin transferase n=1 Tax=Tachysurus vachellii TaxID=175792 RepID=A0AA88NUV3_TACVA|nr:hypothetical protein Q7C36_003296 [Tachysurus vachellii]
MSSPYSSKDRDTLTQLPCKLCLKYVPLEHMTTISQCLCLFCILCLKWYIELLIKEGLQTGISCPNSACPKQRQLLENERDRRLQFEREVLVDPCRTWCPSCSYQAVCQLQEAELPMPQLVKCPLCILRFCSACHADWHKGQTCQGPLPIGFYQARWSIFIERDEGCAQTLCKDCKHAFCWYCLESLDMSHTDQQPHYDDFLLIHYDTGSCQNKLGHSRAAVTWHRTQVCNGDFAGFVLLLLVASPFLLLATPFFLFYKCRCGYEDDDPLLS